MMITYTEKKRDALIVLFSDDTKYRISYKTANDFKLCKGSFPDKEALLEADYAFEVAACTKYSLDVLAISDKSVKEMRDKLKNRYYQPKAVEAVIEKLVKNGFLNDHDYAFSLAQSYASAGKGRAYIKGILLKKGFDKALTEEALNVLSSAEEEESLQKLLRRQNELLKRYPFKVRREKLIRKAIAAGFKASAAQSMLGDIFSKDEENSFEDYFSPLIEKRYRALRGKKTPREIKAKLYGEFIAKGAAGEFVERKLNELFNEELTKDETEQ